MSTIKDLVIKGFKTFLNEGGDGGAVRYNSELAALMSWSGGVLDDNFDPTSKDFDPSKYFPKNKLKDADQVYNHIKNPKFLPKYYDVGSFKAFYKAAQTHKKSILSAGGNPTSFGWVGGNNRGGDRAEPADVDFYGSDVSGVSVKAKGGITLSNLTPKKLGLSTEKGVGVLNAYSTISTSNVSKTIHLYKQFKENVFKRTLAAAFKAKGKKVVPNPQKSSKYHITYVEEKKHYIIGFKGGKTVTKTQDEILGDATNFKKNIIWHRVFGDYAVKNPARFEVMSDRYFTIIGRNMVDIITASLVDDTLLRALNIGLHPYIYYSPKGIYRVPSIDEVNKEGLELKSFTMKHDKKGAGGIQFLLKVGTKGDNKNIATVDVHIRYANGVFTTNPTARFQNVTNASGLLWKKL